MQSKIIENILNKDRNLYYNLYLIHQKCALNLPVKIKLVIGSEFVI